VVISPEAFRPENDCTGEDLEKLKTTDPSSFQRGCYIRTITASVQLENKNSGRGSQGACR
jgi:hypothetical protein